jgi:GT2 family glycosyltransferase
MKYSIIIPTVGRKSLLSVIEGIYICDSFKKINPEILVIFDGNKSKFSHNLKQDNLKILYTEEQVFAGGARNLGIKKATGDILIFIGDNGVPDKFWLSNIIKFHEQFPKKNIALLGKTIWQEKTDFTNFLENNAQFNYKKIIKSGATWQHFYTSNISLKKEFLGSEIFSNKFKGWGFEDSEFGYRLKKRGLEIIFNEDVKIFRTDHPDISSVISKTKSARENAKVFESLHQEIKILPRGLKKIFLNILIFFAKIFSPFSPKIKWWYLWKKAWVRG